MGVVKKKIRPAHASSQAKGTKSFVPYIVRNKVEIVPLACKDATHETLLQSHRHNVTLFTCMHSYLVGLEA